MSDRLRLIKYVRFQLDELSAENGHHTFEHICRHVARARIASNLLPATGPVGGGGDAGRDFETFESYLPKELGEHSAFVARLSDKRLAFACTIQREKAEQKFLRDAKTIHESGDRVEHVYAMCLANVGVGRRNWLRNKVRKYGMDLTLLDGQWLAEQLADPDLFWVADAYLSVPAHMAPAVDPEPGAGVPSWYAESLGKWKDRGELRPTIGDLLDAKDGLRYATFNDAGRADLDFWLALVQPLTTEEHPPSVRQRARYEYAVATLRGGGEMRPADDVVRAYFADALSEDDAARLKDVSVLLNYAVGAYSRNLTDLDAAYLHDVNDRVRDHLRSVLQADPFPHQRARVLDVLGHLSLQLDPRQLAQADRPQLIDVNDYLDEHGEVKVPPAEPLTEVYEVPFVDVDEGMSAWQRLAEHLPEAPLFPTEELSVSLNVLTPLLIDHPSWRELVDAVDEALRVTAGNASAADSARDRAMRLYEAGRLLDALEELHTAKANWWSGDSVEGALLAMLLIASIYRELGLMQAAKQYGLAATGTAMAMAATDASLLRYATRGLFSAAHSEFLAGAWCGALELFEFAFVTLNHLEDGVDLANEEVADAVFNFASLLRRGGELIPELRDEFEQAAQRCGMEDLLEASQELPEAELDDAVEFADTEMRGRPFSDVGDQRVMRFGALGLDWTVRCPNEYRNVLVAERFAAAAQVLLVELARKDLCFLRTTIEVHVKPEAVGSERAWWEPSNDGRVWQVHLMPEPEVLSEGHLPEHDVELLAVLSSILTDASLLPHEVYLEQLDDAARRGLSHKLGSGRPYDELANVTGDERFEQLRRVRSKPPADPAAYPTREHTELAWQGGPGPTFSRERSDLLLRNRYEAFSKTLRVTLPRLLIEPSFRALVAELREEGWKDWHILSAVMTQTHNTRMGAAGFRSQHEEDPELMKKFHDLAFEEEQPSWPTPPLRFYSRAELVKARQVSMLATLKAWDLEVNPGTPDIPAVERLLEQRYGYWDDDIDHEDPFPQVTSPLPPRPPSPRKTRARRN